MGEVTGIGIDLVSVAEVADAAARWGDRYLRAVYDEQELRDCRIADPGGPATDPPLSGASAASLAGRFAAKEAVVKALAHRGGHRWRDIGIRRAASGRLSVELSGGARTTAEAAGVAVRRLSLTHDAGIAVAVAMAERTELVHG
jgi:holo-[acyl-carrier protein] synthase